jgi:regulator of protease activity HflC (stomatin/prohibitin superfamily)
MTIIFTVPQGHVAIITRFGKYVSTKKQGLRSRLPFFERIHKITDWNLEGKDIAHKDGWKIELSEQNLDTRPREAHSKDNVPITVDATIYWRIIEPHKAVFEVDNLPLALRDTCLNALRGELGKLTLDQILTTRQSLSEKITVSLKDISSKWGVQVNRVEIQELKTSDEIAKAMRLEMSAERKKRADILEAEGEAQAKIKKAEAEATAIKLKAEAEAHYITKLSAVLGKEVVGKILLSEKILEAYKAISSSASSKVFLPSNINTIINDQMQGNEIK